ncbi:MAG: VOC family protein [Flammeovirgaceae bacterium]
MEKLINIENGHPVDHIAIGVSNTEEGAKHVEELTGVSPYFHPPEPHQWYYSAALNLGGNCALEIIGPNPNHKGFQPIKQLLKSFKNPQLFFWYLGTNHFQKVKDVVESIGFKLERIEHLKYKRNTHETDYKRALIGPGFKSEFPNLIQWNSRPPRLNQHTGCQFKSLEIISTESNKLNSLFEELGIEIRAIQGDSAMSLIIDTPKGAVCFTGGGFKFEGIRAIPKMIKLYIDFLTNK